MSHTPARTLVQRMDALAKGNTVRTRRKTLKRDVKAGKLSAKVVLANPPEYAETMKVIDLLLSIPKIGQVKADKVLRQARISPSKTLGGLSERQRNELVYLVRT